MSGLSETPPDLPTTAVAVKTFHAKTVQSLSDCDIPKNSEFRPIRSVSEHEECQSSPEIEKLASKLTISENNLNATNLIAKTNGAKKKRKRKKKTSSAEGREELHEEESSKLVDDAHLLCEDTCYVGGRKESPKMSSSNDEEAVDARAELNCQAVSSLTSDLHFFSDTDIPCW